MTARIGYAWDRFLGYATGGGAWERDNYDRFDLAGGALVGSARETRGGWTVGVGGEYAFTNSLSGFAEYNYYDFGTRTLTFLDPVGGFDDNISIRERKSVVRAGLNLRWGGGPGSLITDLFPVATYERPRFGGAFLCDCSTSSARFRTETSRQCLGF